MTPRERAEEVAHNTCGDWRNGDGPNWEETVTAIERHIIAAVEAEREACAKIAEEAGPKFFHKDMSEAATSIAEQIRARLGKL
jgi:hypothetical protein